MVKRILKEIKERVETFVPRRIPAADRGICVIV